MEKINEIAENKDTKNINLKRFGHTMTLSIYFLNLFS